MLGFALSSEDLSEDESEALAKYLAWYRYDRDQNAAADAPQPRQRRRDHRRDRAATQSRRRRGRLPTPVEDLVVAAGLAPSDELPFDESVLRRAPAELAAKIRQLGIPSKIHAMLDRWERKVYINPEIQHDARRRFRAPHEVGHDILPSQRDWAYADNAATLSWLSKVRAERDANQTGAELLFQLDVFATMASEYRVGMAAVIDLANRFGASYQAALRRFAETHVRAVAGLVLDHSPSASEPLTFRRREVICSEKWEDRFGRIDRWPDALAVPEFPFVAQAQTAVLLERQTAGEMRLCDRSLQVRDLRVEAFSNSYKVLVLLWEPQRELFKRRRRLAAAWASRPLAGPAPGRRR